MDKKKQTKKKPTRTASEERKKRRLFLTRSDGSVEEVKMNRLFLIRLGVFMAAGVVCFALFVAGDKVSTLILPGTGVGAATLILLLPLMSVPVIVSVLNRVSEKRIKTQQDDLRAEDFVQLMLRHRENAAAVAEEKYRVLHGLRSGENACTGLLLGTGSLTSFLAGGMLTAIPWLALVFYVAGILLSVAALLGRTHQFDAEPDEPGENTLPPEDFPAIYAAVRRAADEMGYTGPVRIELIQDSGAGISPRKNSCVVSLGIMLWYVLQPEELHAVLLHEFAHLKNRYIGDRKLLRAVWRHCTPEMNSVAWRWPNRLFYSAIDLSFSWQYFLFQYSVTLQTEAEADELMRRKSSATEAASGLLKTAYGGYYEWMNGTVMQENAFRNEETFDTYVKRDAECFRQTAEAQCEKWNTLIEKAILSRSDTHPLIRDRIERLGFEKPFVPDFTRGADALTAECDAAVHYLQTLIKRNLGEPFDDLHDRYWKEPEKTVLAWEAEGRPLSADAYPDIDDALRSLDRNEEANALCGEAIDTLTPSNACHARFKLGFWLLHDFDPAGIELMYEAAEGNHNYAPEAFDTIGAFCCMMGLQDELDAYRLKAVDYMQQEKDLFSRTGQLQGTDKITPERLPQSLLDGLLEVLRREDTGCIVSVHVLHRPVTEDYAESPVVVRVKPRTPEEEEDKIMHAVFLYLDAADWHFSLFDYVHAAAKVDRGILEQSIVYIGREDADETEE